jgi:2-aminoethylphosphonate transport system substrate-binding protein
MKSLLSALLVAVSFAAPAFAASDVVTVYAADGLHDGKGSWFETQFDAFTKATGIKVQYVEGGSGGVVERVAKEKTNPQADVLVTLPPFIQRAEATGLLQPFQPMAASAIDGGRESYQPLVNNFQNFIYNSAELKEPPKSFDDLLGPKFKGKIQYSTPGQAGDGTAVMLQVIHAFGSKDAAFDYLKKLQDNNVGPSASTGKLTALVNKGELYVANGDLQMNMSQMTDNPNIKVFWPAGPNGERSAMPLPYYIGLVAGAPDADNGKKLIEFLLSKEAQGTVSSVALGMPVRKDVTPTDANFTKLHDAMQGVTIWTPDWAQVLKDLPADVGRWKQATGS